MLADSLRVVLTWIAAGDRTDPRYTKLVARRCIGALWTINPDYFDGLSLAEIAREAGVHCHKWTLSKQARAFADEFGIQNRSQFSEDARRAVRIGHSKPRAVGATRTEGADGGATPNEGAKPKGVLPAGTGGAKESLRGCQR